MTKTYYQTGEIYEIKTKMGTEWFWNQFFSNGQLMMESYYLNGKKKKNVYTIILQV